jgi:hypothetical protein
VPDFHFNTLLGQVFEAKVGQGSLLVCGYDVTGRLAERPAARQFRRSLFRYVASAAFRPEAELSAGWVAARFQVGGLAGRGARVLRVSSEDAQHGNVGANILDGDPSTYWHTRWQPDAEAPPHELVIDLGKELTLRGLTFLPRQDQSNGRVARGAVFAGLREGTWGEPVARLRGENEVDLMRIEFPAPVVARYLRVVVEAEVNGQPFAALSELDCF